MTRPTARAPLSGGALSGGMSKLITPDRGGAMIALAAIGFLVVVRVAFKGARGD